MKCFLNKRIVATALIVTTLNANAIGYIEIREKEDNFKTLKKITLKQDEEIQIDVKKIGWKSCKVFSNEAIVGVACFVSNDKSISYSCYGNESIEVDLSGNNYLMSLKINCSNKK